MAEGGVAEGERVDVPAHALVARRVKSSKSHVRIKSDQDVEVLLPAFRETRPGGISVDVLWDESQRPGPAGQQAILKDAADIAAVEGFDLKGWASFKASLVISKSYGQITRVVHSGHDKNARHGDLVIAHYIEPKKIEMDLDAEKARALTVENEHKADLIAFLLQQFFANHGKFIFKP